MNEISFVLTDNNITCNYAGETHIVKRSDPLADKLIAALRENRLKDIPSLVSAAKRLEKYSHGNFVVKNGVVHVNGVAAPQVLSDKIMRFSDEGLPYQPLVKFAEKLQANPSFRAVNELYSFIEKNDITLTADGSMILYKKVKEDFTDVHTGKFDNTPGQVLEMPRNQVDEDSNSHCSHGFHCGSFRYCHEFYSSSGNMLEVKVNPADVVSVPNDLNEKVRVCKYEVVGVVNAELSTPIRYMDEEERKATESDDQDNSPLPTCGDCERIILLCSCDDEKEMDECPHCGETDCYGDCDDCEGCGEGPKHCYCEDVEVEEETKDDPYPYHDELDE
jgi:hypothetical protein